MLKHSFYSLLLVTLFCGNLLAVDDREYYGRTGGYRTETQIIGTRELYSRKQFSHNNFEPWLSVYQHAQAYDAFNNALLLGSISEQGDIQKTPLTFGSKTFHHKRKLTPIELIKYYPQNSQSFYKKLENIQLLDSFGSVLGLNDKHADSATDVDFSPIQQRLDNLNLDIAQKNMQRELKRELYRFMVTQHTIREVTQRETTRYNSTKDGFFENFKDQVFGSLAGKIFFKDKNITSKQRARWVNSTSIPSYYPNLQDGFNRYPYENKSKGLIAVNGRQRKNTLSLETFSPIANTSLYSLAHTHYRVHERGDGFQGSLQYYGGKISGSYLDTTTGKTGILNISTHMGSASEKVEAQFQFGLTGRKIAPHTSLGWNIGGHLEGFVYNPLKLFGAFYSASQPNFNTGETVWDLSQIQLGLGLNFKQIEGRIGYQWYTTSETDTVDGWFFGLGYSL